MPRVLDRRRLYWEIAIVLAITFGASGLRSLFRLISAVASPVPLNQQSTTLNASQSAIPWLDFALQLLSATTLLAWGALVLFLAGTAIMGRWTRRSLLEGVALAALIGIPGLALYICAVHLGWSKQVIPAAIEHPLIAVPVLLLWSAANAFAEEAVVVAWFITRLRQLNASPWIAILLAALLRGSYHLYQGFSAGLGNVAMGLVFGYFYTKTSRAWPLVIAHLLIDATAFLSYHFLRGNLDFLGL